MSSIVVDPPGIEHLKCSPRNFFQGFFLIASTKFLFEIYGPAKKTCILGLKSHVKMMF